MTSADYLDSDMTSWLDHLCRIVPPAGVLVAGSGSGGWIRTLEKWNVQSVLFAEADAAQIERMKKAYTLPEQCRISHTILWNEEARLTFHRASNPALSSVISPDSFTPLWPNLTERDAELRRSETIDRLLDQNNMPVCNWYIIDCLPALPVLQGAEAKIEECEVVLARVLYDSNAMPEAGTGKSEVDGWLGEKGFRLIASFEEDHPEVGLALYLRDWKRKESRMKLSAKEVASENETLLAQAEAFTEDNAAKSRVIEEQKARIEALESRLDAATKRHEETVRTLQKEKEAECGKSTDLLARFEQLERLEQRMEKIAALVNENHAKEDRHLEAMEKHINTAVTKGMANVIKQIESFVSLQYYLAHGMQPLNFHGWPISQDIALFLIQKIERNRYDLIIEFGSGTSTVLFAQALKSLEAAGAQPSGRKIVTFEHNEKYFGQTLQTLTSQNLDKYVELVHAPLVKYTYEENEFMYYDCGQKFEALKAESQQSKPSILLFVDGPPGATGPLARFPGLPHLLQQFSDHKIDLVLDDYYRADEKAIVEKWEKLLEAKGITFQSESVPSEKGLYYCQMNEFAEKPNVFLNK